MTYNPKITPKFLLADSDIDKTVLQASRKSLIIRWRLKGRLGGKPFG